MPSDSPLTFAHDLTAMKDRAFRLGLIKTAHAIDKATQEVGWEIAETRLGQSPKDGERYKKAREKGLRR